MKDEVKILQALKHVRTCVTVTLCVRKLCYHYRPNCFYSNVGQRLGVDSVVYLIALLIPLKLEVLTILHCMVKVTKKD